jgi:ribosome-binding factor A
MGATRRTKRIEALIRAELAELLLRRVRDPRLKEATLTGVDVSPDLSQAKVFFSVLHEEKRAEVEKGFKAAAAFLRRELAARLELKVMPQILPVYDSSLLAGARMTALISEVRQKDSADAGLPGASAGPKEKPE